MAIRNRPYEKPLVQPGHELYRQFYSAVMKKEMVQYDYRTEEEKLFSCVANNLQAARKKRDEWLTRRAKK